MCIEDPLPNCPLTDCMNTPFPHTLNRPPPPRRYTVHSPPRCSLPLAVLSVRVCAAVAVCVREDTSALSSCWFLSPCRLAPEHRSVSHYSRPRQNRISLCPPTAGQLCLCACASRSGSYRTGPGEFPQRATVCVCVWRLCGK